jgi:signal transduction histidine kinase
VIAPQLSSPETFQYVDDADSLISLVHDLRQPLSSIESIAFYLDLHLTPDQQEARKYVLKLQDLVEEARQVLSRAAAVQTKLAVAHA